MVGKLVAGVRYVHISALPYLPESDRLFIQPVLDKATSYFAARQKAFTPTIVAYNKKKNFVSITESLDWDVRFEPMVGQSITFNLNLGTIKHRVPSYNHQIYHRRHLFVHSSYNGFDIELDKARVKSWECHHPDITRMGRVNWWTEFCNQHNLIPR
jgi:hypothetical protein